MTSGIADTLNPRHDRQVAFRMGLSAESRAAMLLIAKGFRILARRWKSPVGEIDIVARRRNLLVFVEVKARAGFDEAAFAVTSYQRLRILSAARAWLARHPDDVTCATVSSGSCTSESMLMRIVAR